LTLQVLSGLILVARLGTNLRVVPRSRRVKHLLGLLELEEHQTLLPVQTLVLGAFLEMLRPSLPLAVRVEWVHVLLVREHDVWLSTALVAVVFNRDGLGIMNHKLELVGGRRALVELALPNGDTFQQGKDLVRSPDEVRVAFGLCRRPGAVQ
jgi:hypothetical protein